MSSSPFDLAGTRPDPDKYEILAYRQTLLAHAYAPLMESRKARATTYYVDSVAGSDSNDGLSIGAPVQTLSKVNDISVANSGGDFRIRFKYGSEFIGKGANALWLTDATQHHVAASFNGRSNITVDCYGDPTAGPVKFRVTTGGALSGSWTAGPDANTFYHSAAGISGTPELVYETGSTTAISRQTSLANCQANARSFWYDSGNDRIYVNFTGTAAAPPSTLYAIEGNTVSCFRFNGDDVIVDLGGAEFYGFGYLIANNNSHDYAIGVQVDGSKVATIHGVKAYYGSAHLVATWINTNQSGGHVSWLNISGHGGHAGRVINVYQSQSGMTAICHNIRAEATTLGAVNGHSGTGEIHSDLWVDSCVGGVTSDSADAAKTVYYGNRDGSPSTPYATIRIPKNGYVVNSEWWCQSSGSGTGGPSALASSAVLYNGIFNFVSTNTLNNAVGVGIFTSSVAALDVDIDAYHTLIRMSNPVNGSTRAVGLSYHAVQANDSPTNSTATRVCWVRSDTKNGSYPVVPGIGNGDAYQINCSYWGITNSTSRNQAGYNNVTTGIELSGDPLVINSGMWAFSPRQEMVRNIAPSVEYDQFGKRRRSDISTDGPVELVPDDVRPMLTDWNDLLRSRNLGSAPDTESAYDKLRRNLLQQQ